MRILAPLLLLAAFVGCNHTAMIEPTTRIGANPRTGQIDVYNTKDVDVTIEGFAATRPSDGAGVTLKKAVISDKSSPVIIENVKQMEVRVKQMEQEVEAIKAIVSVIPDSLRSIAGMMGSANPAGVSKLTGLANLIEMVLNKPATSQPAQ